MSEFWTSVKLCDNPGKYEVFGITVDNNGIIYFATHDENIYQVRRNSKPQILVNVKGGQLRGIVWNNNNILYICDCANHRILSYSIDAGNLSTVTGNGKAGHRDGRFHLAQFKGPQGIAMDRNGDLYITEWYHCVRKINISQKTVITIAGSDNGKSGYKDGDAKQAMFFFPFGIAVSGDDTIYVADCSNHCIRKFKDGIVSTIGGTPRNSKFVCPTALIVTTEGDLLVGDENGLKRARLKKKTKHMVTTLPGVPAMEFRSLAISNQLEIFAGFDCIMKIAKTTWKWKRLVWIGHLKENPNDCLLASLPRDIIKEICQFL